MRADSGLMVSACPQEGDPRDKVEDFVRNPDFKVIAGLRTDGLQFLMDLVESEIRKQEPESEIVHLDREVLSDNGIDFAKDLGEYFVRKASGGRRVNFLMVDDLPVVGWQSAVASLVGRDAQVYGFSVACRQIPMCSKLV